MRNAIRAGFTLVEMIVIAPIVILLIGVFIALIVNLTGEVLSSNGSNRLAYEVQDTLNRIEEDVRLSTTFLATNNISVDTTKQGYGGDATNGSTAKFRNIATGGAPASLIINGLVTNGNPLSQDSNLVYLANMPNGCSDLSEYSKNRPMTMNIVYFVDANNTLWRRTLMPANYDSPAIRCGTAPWQQPSCTPGYNAGSRPFCKTNDIKLIEGISPSDFSFQYYPKASASTPNPTATNPSASDEARNIALQSTPTVGVSIAANKSVAGRDISRSGELRATRLDTNASSIATIAPPTVAPAAPKVTATVANGNKVTFNWPQVAGATAYNIDYRIGGGSWQSAATGLGNNNRTYTVTQANHKDTVEARVQAENSFGPSTYGTATLTIPLWAPLPFQGNWTDYEEGYNTAGYTKTSAGFVMLKGLVSSPVAQSSGSAIGKLPDDYAPSQRLLFGTATWANVTGRLDVISDGRIIFDTGSINWISLETIRFIAGSAGYTKTPASLGSGFTNYGGTYAPAAYVQDSAGRVTIEGLIINGNSGVGHSIFTIPAALRPPQDLIYAGRSTTFNEVGVSSSLVTRTSGPTGYMTINASYLPSSYSGWINLTLQNGWVNYSSTFANAQYTKTSDGVVHLKGLVRSGSTASQTVIATLPVGYRPSQRILQSTVSVSNFARLDISPNGQVLFMGSSNGWYSLDNIMFPVE